MGKAGAAREIWGTRKKYLKYCWSSSFQFLSKSVHAWSWVDVRIIFFLLNSVKYAQTFSIALVEVHIYIATYMRGSVRESQPFAL